MEHIKDIAPKAIEAAVQRTKVSPLNTRVLAKFNDHFQTLDDPKLERMFQTAVRFGSEMCNEGAPRWLSLLGPSGVGKTLTARLLYRLYRDQFDGAIDWKRTREAAAKGHCHIFKFRSGFLNWGEAVNHRMMKGQFEFLEDMRDYNFFAIDDIVAEHEKHRELSASKLYDVLNGRVGKWTVITANLSLDQIGEKLDPRIASRMLRDGSEVIDIDVPDYNLRRAAA